MNESFTKPLQFPGVTYVDDLNPWRIFLSETALDFPNRNHLLLAVESGSRTWGFPSEKSDYDLRFVYVQRVGDYLLLDGHKDVYENVIVRDGYKIDAVGWDLGKFLRLSRSGNAASFEWLYSCPVYHFNVDFLFTARDILKEYIDPVSMAFHYYGMANGHYKRYIDSGDTEVERKKYLYLLRAISLMIWYRDNSVLHEKELAPTDLETSIELLRLDGEVADVVDKLLYQKRDGDELGKAPRLPALDEFIEDMLNWFRSVWMVADKKRSWEPLNAFFYNVVMRYYRGG